MSRLITITLLAVIATTAAKPHYVAYPSRYYGGYFGPAYSAYDYPVFSYPYTPVTYVETVPITTVLSGPPPAAVPFAAKLVGKNGGPPPRGPSSRLELPAPPPPPRAPSARQELPAPPPPPPQAPPAPAAPPAPPKGPVKVIFTKQLVGLPDLDPSKLLEALPLQQLLDLPPVKQLVEFKTSKLQTIMGLKNTLQGALQEKLAPIAALLP